MKEFFYRVKRLGWLKNRFRFRVAKWSLPIRRFQRLIADPCHQEVSRYAYAADTAGCQLRTRLNVTPPHTTDWLKTASAAAPTPGTAPALPYRYTADCV